MSDLRAIMAEVRAAQDAELGDGADDLDAVAARLRAELEAPRAVPRRRTWVPLAAAAAVLLAIVGSAAALVRTGLLGTMGAEDALEPAQLSWRVDAPEAQTYEGWVATGERPGRLMFSDGSRLALAGSTRLRVLDVRADGATLVLEDGEVNARIRRRSEPTWRLHAGPFLIAVRGTTFTTRWDAQRGALALSVIEGRVRLGGACMDRDRDVSAGEHVELRCPLPGSVEAPVEPASERAATDVMSATPRRERRAAPPLATVEPVASIEVSDAGEALRIASATAAAGDAAEATRRLEALRGAHPGTDEAALAAFLLGRIAFDEQRDAGTAARWLRAYLEERPAGALAREARGRLLEALQASGRSEEARDEASLYLARYPGGPHAELARRLARP